MHHPERRAPEDIQGRDSRSCQIAADRDAGNDSSDDDFTTPSLSQRDSNSYDEPRPERHIGMMILYDNVAEPTRSNKN